MTQDVFQVVIRAYLDAMAKHDEAFAEKYANPKKSLAECENYIYNQVKKANRIGFADEEIFGFAVHYYDEAELPAEDLKPVTNVRTVINEKIEKPKAETKKSAKAEPKKPVKSESKKGTITKPITPNKPVAQPKAEKPTQAKQMDLFGDYNPFK